MVDIVVDVSILKRFINQLWQIGEFTSLYHSVLFSNFPLKPSLAATQLGVKLGELSPTWEHSSHSNFLYKKCWCTLMTSHDQAEVVGVMPCQEYILHVFLTFPTVSPFFYIWLIIFSDKFMTSQILNWKNKITWAYIPWFRRMVLVSLQKVTSFLNTNSHHSHESLTYNHLRWSEITQIYPHHIIFRS